MNTHPHRAYIPALLLLLALTQQASAQPPTTQPKLSITLLVDLSYSMRLPLSLNKDDRRGPTRLEEAKRLIEALLNDEEPPTEWSLLTFGGAGSEARGRPVDVRLAFTEERARVRSVVDRLTTWGVSPLADAISFAERYSNEDATGAKRVVLVVTDGIDTVPNLFHMPGVSSAGGWSSPLLLAGIRLGDQEVLAARLRSWVRETGGGYVDAADPAAVSAALSGLIDRAGRASPQGRPISTQPSGAKGGTMRSDAGSASPSRAPPLRRAFPPVSLWWLLIPVVLIPSPLIVYAIRARHRRAVRRRILRIRREVMTIHLDLLRPGRRKELVFEETPIRLAANGERRAARRRPLIHLEGGAAVLRAKPAVLVNGVARRETLLAAGDRVHTRDGVWIFRGVVKEEVGPPLPGSIQARLYYLSSGFIASLLVVAAGLAFLSFSLGGPASVAASTQSVHAPSAHEALALPASANAVSSSESRSEGASTTRGEGGDAGSVLTGRDGIPHSYLHTVMIPPGSRPQYFKADIMFIHTHPDDESIDFGGLMALEARSGKQIVSVIFTDGTAGLDQFPNRRVGGRYPDHALRGTALARVRVQEAESALSILGSREYVRLGLLNNPYDSIRQILPLHVVLKRWGGDAQVVGKLVSLLEGFRPDIVVSPDKHHRGVFKHFEHEAVGYVTDQALSYLRSHGQDFVQAHLIGVDPMLTSQYRGVFGVNVMAVDPESGFTYRAVQVEALKQHVTQRDASVIGVEVVPNFADEYYVAESWRLAVPPERYFQPSVPVPKRRQGFPER